MAPSSARLSGGGRTAPERGERPSPPLPQHQPAASSHPVPGAVVTTFRWPSALGGSSVSIVGSFNGWSTPLPLGRADNGDHVRSVCLPPGAVQFKYLVDGEWLISPCEQQVSDGGGNYNNYRRVVPGSSRGGERRARATWPGVEGAPPHVQPR